MVLEERIRKVSERDDSPGKRFLKLHRTLVVCRATYNTVVTVGLRAFERRILTLDQLWMVCVGPPKYNSRLARVGLCLNHHIHGFAFG